MDKQHADAMDGPAGVTFTEGPAGMQQDLLVGRGQRFTEDVPGASSFYGTIGCEKLGRQVQREAADQSAAGAYTSTDDVRRCRPSSVCDQRK